MSNKSDNPEFIKLACAEAKKLGEADRTPLSSNAKNLRGLSEHTDEAYLGFFQDKYLEVAGVYAQSVKAAILVNQLICKYVLTGERKSHKGVDSVIRCSLILRTRDNLAKALKTQLGVKVPVAK